MPTMETTACESKSVHERLEAVAEGLDLNDSHIRRAYDKVRRALEGAEPIAPEKVLATIDAPELIGGLNAVLVAEIAMEAAAARAKFLKRKRDVAVEQAKLLIEEQLDIDLDDSGGLDVLRCCVRKDDPDRKIKAAKRVVEATRNLLELDMVTIKVSAEGELDEEAAALASDDVPAAYIKDICEVLAENGKTGRDLIEKILTEHGVAARVAADEDMPHPLRFLAAMTQMASAADTSKEDGNERQDESDH